MRHGTEHVDWNDLAALAEQGGVPASEQTLAHLAVCAECLAAYGEAVRSRDGILAGERPAVPAVPRLRVVPRRRRWGKAAWSTGGLAAAAVLLVLLMPRQPEVFGPGDPRFALQERLAELSGAGPVYPGVERVAAGAATRYRSGGDAATPGIDALLQPWAERFGADPADSDAAYWLSAGYLASGRLNYADDVLRRALQRHPDAAGLRHLDAVTAYRLNELDRAEDALRAILARRPADGVARFNLALIAFETQRLDEARTALRDLAADEANPAVQERARQLLAIIDG